MKAWIGGRRIRWPFPVAMASVLAMATAGLFVLRAGREPAATEGLWAIETIPAGNAPFDVSAGRDSVWVTSGGDGSLLRLDPSGSASTPRSIHVGPSPAGVDVGGGYVWVGRASGSDITRVAEATAEVDRLSIPVGRTPQFVAVGEGAVWVPSLNGKRVARLDPSSGDPLGAPVGTGHSFMSSVDTGFGAAWVTDVVDDVVIRIDAGDPARQTAIPVGRSPLAVAAGEDAVWVATFGDRSLWRIDPRTNRRDGRPVRLGGRPGSVAVGEGQVWVTLPDRGLVARIDPQSGRIAGPPVPVGKTPQGIDVGFGSVWVANEGSDTVTRVRL